MILGSRHAWTGGIAPPVLLLLAGLAVFVAHAAAGPEDGHACPVVLGRVLDSVDGHPVALAHIRVPDLQQGAVSRADGSFLVRDLPAGGWVVECTHLGYEPWRRRVDIPAADTLRLDIRLVGSAIQLEPLTVQAGVEAPAETQAPEWNLRSAELARAPGATLAATLDGRTGVSQRSMGPGPARPVLRGLSGDRLRIQEDGAGTGDLSAGSADHAVALDALAAGRVTLVRGPQALLSSSAAVGGVLEVERGRVPRRHLERVEGEAILTTESASRSHGGAVVLAAPVADLDLRVDGGWRRAGDLRTPAGALEPSDLDSWSAGLGAAAGWGHWRLGAGLSSLSTDYGIPGGFAGAHPFGVGIRMEKDGALLQASWNPDRAEDPDHGLRGVAFQSQWSDYSHVELESSGAVGMSFDQLSHEGQLDLRLGSHGPFREGRLRIQQVLRHLETGGLTHMPTVTEQGWAVATTQVFSLGRMGGEAALRGDWRGVAPAQERRSILVGHIRGRSFAGASGALSLWPGDGTGTEGWRPGLTLLRSWRAPSVEELFSGGPHLAAYSFEIGNPDLEAETSWSLEIHAERQSSQGRLRLTTFATRFDGYLFPSFTGRFSPRRADLYEYRVLGRDALFTGAEGEGEWRRGPWRVEAGGSWVRGDLAGGGPLPAVPPLKGRLRLARRWAGWEAEGLLETAAAQDRVYRAEDPGAQAEPATAGWARLDLGLVWQGGGTRSTHQVSLRLRNALDQEWRDHLNRVRVVMPEAGRSLAATWKVWF